MTQDEIEVGKPCIYWGVIKPNGERFDPLKTEIISEAWQVGAETVCKIKGKSGGVSIKHLDKISPGSLLAAQLLGCKDVSDSDFKKETEKFFTDRGVKVTFHK